MVDLPTGKMKSREGTIVDADELIEQMNITASKITEEHGKIDGMNISERDKLFYKIGESAPFTGVITQENTEAGYLFLGRTNEGKKDGPWVKWFSEGKKVPEILLSDVPEPQPEIPWSGNKEEQGQYKNGKRDGEWTFWHDNEHIKSTGFYKDGLMNGPWKFYYKNGVKEKEKINIVCTCNSVDCFNCLLFFSTNFDTIS